MEISQTELFFLIVYSAVGGLVLGAAYDAERVIRMVLTAVLAPVDVPTVRVFGRELALACRRACGRARFGRLFKVILNIAVILMDVLFMVLAAVLVILMSYACNSGRLRWMIYAGTALGFFLYSLTFGFVVKRLLLTAVIVFGNIAAALTGRATRAAACAVNKTKSILSKVKNKRSHKKQRKKGGGNTNEDDG